MKIKLTVYIIAALLIVGLIGFFISNRNTTLNHINKKWGLEIDKRNDVVYSHDERGSFGEGIIYLKIELSEDDNFLTEIDFTTKTDDNIDLETIVNQSLDQFHIQINESAKIDWSMGYSFKIFTDSGSTLYLIYFEQENVLYLIEKIE